MSEYPLDDQLEKSLVFMTTKYFAVQLCAWNIVQKMINGSIDDKYEHEQPCWRMTVLPTQGKPQLACWHHYRGHRGTPTSSGPFIKMYVNKKYRICTFSTIKNQDKSLTYTKLNPVT